MMSDSERLRRKPGPIYDLCGPREPNYGTGRLERIERFKSG